MMTLEIHHRTGDYHGDGSDLLIWEIHDEQGVASALYVSNDERREIVNIETRQDRRGEGLATALFRAADAQVGIYHAPVAHRTDEGAAWAEAVGGETAVYDCDCYGCTIDAERAEQAAEWADENEDY